MRIAYLILAHRQPWQVARLVSRLSTNRPSSETTFFIHVDKKTDEATYRQFTDSMHGFSNVHFVKRHVCHWAEFGLVRAALEGIAEILRAPQPADYIVLLSGEDYPIKTNDYINEFFERGAGRSYISHDTVPSSAWPQAASRIGSWHAHLLGRPVLLGRTTLGASRKWPVVAVSYCLPRERRFPRGYQPYTGSAYWAMTRDAAQLVYDVSRSNRALLRFFKYTCCPDELFFQTVLLNSKLKAEIVDSDLHFIDWSRGGAHPLTLGAADLDRLAGSPALFARKFDADVDETILRLIDEKLLGTLPAGNDPEGATAQR